MMSCMRFLACSVLLDSWRDGCWLSSVAQLRHLTFVFVVVVCDGGCRPWSAVVASRVGSLDVICGNGDGCGGCDDPIYLDIRCCVGGVLAQVIPTTPWVMWIQRPFFREIPLRCLQLQCRRNTWGLFRTPSP